MTDTQGLVLKAKLHEANVHDSPGARLLLAPARGQFPRLSVIWADQAYQGDELAAWVREQMGAGLEIVRRTSKQQKWQQTLAVARERARAGASAPEMWAGLSLGRGMEGLPRRWVVERTFAWLGKSRRLAKDYELLPETGEALIYLAMTRLMLRRLAKPVSGAPS